MHKWQGWPYVSTGVKIVQVQGAKPLGRDPGCRSLTRFSGWSGVTPWSCHMLRLMMCVTSKSFIFSFLSGVYADTSDNWHAVFQQDFCQLTLPGYIVSIQINTIFNSMIKKNNNILKSNIRTNYGGKDRKASRPEYYHSKWPEDRAKQDETKQCIWYV